MRTLVITYSQMTSMSTVMRMVEVTSSHNLTYDRGSTVPCRHRWRESNKVRE